jgi:hypothetical protein
MDGKKGTARGGNYGHLDADDADYGHVDSDSMSEESDIAPRNSFDSITETAGVYICVRVCCTYASGKYACICICSFALRMYDHICA